MVTWNGSGLIRGRWRSQSVRCGSKWLKISGVLAAEELSSEFNKLRAKLPSWLILCSELFSFFFISPLEPRPQPGSCPDVDINVESEHQKQRKGHLSGKEPRKKKSNYLSHSITACLSCSASTWEESTGSARNWEPRHTSWMPWLNDPSLRCTEEIILGCKPSPPCDVLRWIIKLVWGGRADLCPTGANLLLRSAANDARGEDYHRPHRIKNVQVYCEMLSEHQPGELELLMLKCGGIENIT